MRVTRSPSTLRGWKLALAALLLAGLYWAADWRAVGRVLVGLDPWCLAAGMLLFVPQIAVSAMRWRVLVAPVSRISILEAIRHVLAASALNLIVPSKLGDLSKAVMLQVGGAARRARAAAYVAMEKFADLAALALIWLWANLGLGGPALLAILLATAFAIPAVKQLFTRRPYVPSTVVPAALASLLLWALHLLQIDFFLKAAGVFVPWHVSAARVPAALLAGLVPVSFCGLGTRDAALVWLFSDVAPAPVMAAVGALTALRYLVPGIIGIPLAAGALRARRGRDQRAGAGSAPRAATERAAVAGNR